MFLKQIPVFLLVVLFNFGSATQLKIEIEGYDSANFDNEVVWTWSCETGGCKKISYESGKQIMSKETCNLVCNNGNLWPNPTGNIEISNTFIPINQYSISVEMGSVNSPKRIDQKVIDLVRNAGKLLSDRLISKIQGTSKLPKRSLIVTANLEDSDYSLKQETDESYNLYVNPYPDGRVNATIQSKSFFGFRHGLETLSQLIILDSLLNSYLIPKEISISDKPTFSYRGILLDTARNYVTVDTIKRTLDAMAASKLNTFHWHITDSQSFPFESKTFPLFTKYGAYSPKQIYTESDIKMLVEYARVRGVRIIPEFDAPAHVGEGWQWVKENATVCFRRDPWMNYCVEPPCGQLNPTSEEVYRIIRGIYKDMLRLFDSDLFHMGGDEVNINCWNTSSEVYDKMKDMQIERTEEGFHDLWSIFQSRAHSILNDEAGEEKTVVLWTSSLTKDNIEKHLDNKKNIIQIWTKGNDKEIATLLNKGYRVIFSNYDALYFDCGFGAWVGTGLNWCSPYIPWQTVYDNDPLRLASELDVDKSKYSLILGAEATLWTEQADDSSIDNRLWPRAAALGERMWGTNGNWKTAEYRLLYHRQRLVDRGIDSDTVQPEWCLQNIGKCYI